MTHNQRLQWLKARGFLAEIRSCELPDLGMCVWVDGNIGMRPVSLWLSVKDGTAILHGPGDQVMSWESVQDWIEKKEVEAKKPLPAQRNLFE